MDTIVVGVDGSAGSVAALRWAAQEATLRGATLRAVAVWEYPYIYGGITAAIPVPTESLEAEARSTLASAIAAAVDDPAVAERIERVTVSGSPTTVLLNESADATLLVVGARGHGGFVGLLIGSTSDQVVKHARCPVVVVRAPGHA